MSSLRVMFLLLKHLELKWPIQLEQAIRLRAAFVSSILSGLSIGEAHKLAVETSAYVCTQNGAMPVLPQSLKDRVIK